MISGQPVVTSSVGSKFYLHIVVIACNIMIQCQYILQILIIKIKKHVSANDNHNDNDNISDNINDNK